MDYTYKVNKGENLKFELKVTVKYSELEAIKAEELKRYAKGMKLPGFRPGKAPLPMVEQMAGVELIEHSLEHVLQDSTFEIVEKEKLSPISRVNYKLDKFEPGKDIEFTASFHNFPEVKLPDFTKLGAVKKVEAVEEKDIDEVLINFYKDVEKTKEEKIEISKVDDKWVEKLKMKDITTVEQLRKYMRVELEKQRGYEAEDKFLTDLLDKAIEKSKVEVPNEFVESEVKAREARDKERVEGLGLKWEDWLRQQKTDIDKLKSAWTEEITKSYQRDFLLLTISKENNLLGNAEEIEKMMDIYRAQRKLTNEEEENLRLQLSNEITRRRSIDWILKQFK